MNAESLSAEEIQERYDLITHKLKFVQLKPAVLVISRLEPLTFDSAAWESAITLAGGSPENEGRKQLAEMLIIAIRGQPVGAVLAALPELMQNTALSDVPAIAGRRVYILDADRLHTAGDLIKTETVAEIIHPKQFVFGHEGTFWVAFG